jgi:hypothetical protein
MSEACSPHVVSEKYEILVSKHLKRRGHLEGIGVDG